MMTSDITAAVDRQKFVAKSELAILCILYKLIIIIYFSIGLQ